MGIWPIMFVIVMALFAYNVTTESGGMETIQNMLATISTDKRIIVLIIAWGFGGFLESIAGFGTAVAIAAGILVPFILVILTEGSIKAIKGVGFITLMSGLGMAIPPGNSCKICRGRIARNCWLIVFNWDYSLIN